MDVRYIRLRDGSDIIAYCEDLGEKLLLSKPMRVYIETILEEARQTVILDEFLPQKMVEIKSVEILKEDVMFNTPLNKGFLQDYEAVSSACYDEVEEKPKVKEKKVQSSGNDDKIISLLEAIEVLKSRKDTLIN
jgi:hypothetical protein